MAKSSGVFKHRESIKGKGLEEDDADYKAACFLMPGKASFVFKKCFKASTYVRSFYKHSWIYLSQ